MFNWLMNVCPCSCISGSSYNDASYNDDDDAFIWSMGLDKHFFGEFSMAAVQANLTIEDKSHVEIGREATFVGVYDGHGGDETSNFVSDRLFAHLHRLSREMGSTMSCEILSEAFSATENEFISSVVKKKFKNDPKIAAVGSCVLVGVIWKKELYVANLGDCRAVLGYLDISNRITADQLTRDHNANLEVIRNELREIHPDDPKIVTSNLSGWRIKGIIEVSRSIGDAFLKYPEFSLNKLIPGFSLGKTIVRPILREDPDVMKRSIEAADRFIIFASDGLWECLSNQSAVEIVHNNPRQGIAKKLVRAALEEVAKSRNVTYDKIKQIHKNFKRRVHDDMSVVVLFLDHDALSRSDNDAPIGLSVRGLSSHAEQTSPNFGTLATTYNSYAEASNEGETSNSKEISD